MGGPARKKRDKASAPGARPLAHPGRRAILRRVAMVVVSLLLVVGMMLPATGFGLISCSRCSVPIYD